MKENEFPQDPEAGQGYRAQLLEWLVNTSITISVMEDRQVPKM